MEKLTAKLPIIYKLSSGVFIVIAMKALGPVFTPSALAAPPVSFDQDVRPVLSENCFFCHGPDANERLGDLRLDTRQGLFADRDGRSVIRAGDAAGSELFRRITAADHDQRMPPLDSGKQLTPAQIDAIKRWIDQGAAWSDHWAYVAVRRPSFPRVRQADWPRGAIDRFVLSALEIENQKPSPPAKPLTFVRRLFYDLTGLPPTPADVATFAGDRRPAAEERLVDRLLASPAFGERMAVFWLDLVRYADTVGYHGDQEHSISPYRDYVIKAFNENLAFDRFTLEQLAGDLAPDEGTSPGEELWRSVATGYNRLLQTTHEGGAQDKEYRAKYAADRVRNVSSVWLGSTLGCAQCHDHKYDPFTQRDFYAMAAFFADIEEKGAYRSAARPPETPAPSLSQWARIESLNRRIARRRQEQQRGCDSPVLEKTQNELEKKRKELQQSFLPTMITRSTTPTVTRVLPRGDWLDESGEVVQPAPPRFLPNVSRTPPPGVATRLDLARWLTASENPLTARVMVNRLWRLMFGAGIAEPFDDFGAQGQPPFNPKLLDWLAVEFVESGWNVKHLLRLMATSATYRQASAAEDSARTAATNMRFARQHRRRMDAEFIRDNALAVSGLLVNKLGGRSVRPYQPAGYFRHLNFPKRTYEHDVGENQFRRGLYSHWQRVFLHPMFKAFDAPSREECTAQRPVSNTPLSALALLNDPTFLECGRAFAQRIIKEGGPSHDTRTLIRWAWRTALSREPTSQEVAVLTKLYETDMIEYRADPQAAQQLIAIGLSPHSSDVAPEQLAAWTSVARAIMNLNEFITRN